jgi:TolB protein
MRVFVLIGALMTLATGAQASTPDLTGRIVYSSMRGPNVNNGEIYSVRVDGSRRRDLTRNEGSDGEPVPSPDGRSIAFVSDRFDVDGRVLALYVMRADGTDQRRLTPNNLYVSDFSNSLTWSPDSERIAFAGSLGEQVGIWVVRADGRDLRFVAERGRAPAWSPEGSRIAFVAEVPDRPTYHDSIDIVDADGGGRVRLTEGQIDDSPAWSPDGRSLAFVRWHEGTGDLYRIAAGGSPEPLVSGVPGVVREPTWSPSGDAIVYTAGGGDRPFEVFTVSATGGRPRRLGLGELASWSPTGRRIAVAEGAAVYVMNADGTRRRKLQDEGRQAQLFGGPAWAADGQSLLVSSSRVDNDFELFVVNADGSGRRQVTRNNVDDLLPAWSPSRRRIAFVRTAGRRAAIWIISATGANPRQLGWGTHPTWSPSGSRLAFERNGAIFVMTDHGLNVRRIASGHMPAWAPRGASIAFFRNTQLLVADPDTRAVRLVADVSCAEEAETGVSPADWSPHATQLVAAVYCDYGRVAWSWTAVVDADDGRLTYPRLGSIDYTSRIAWSPDGSRLAFALDGQYPRIASSRLDGSAMTTVTTGAGYDRDPDW